MTDEARRNLTPDPETDATANVSPTDPTPGIDTRSWTDREGTDWEVARLERVESIAPRMTFRTHDYAFVGFLPEQVTGEMDETGYQRYVDHAFGRSTEGPGTARLWKDPRSGMEWEVSVEAGEIVFRRGTEVVRAPRGDGESHPRDMSTVELQEALDEAQESED